MLSSAVWLVWLLAAAACSAFVIPVSSRHQTSVSSHALLRLPAWKAAPVQRPVAARRGGSIKMEVDAAVVGGAVAGLVGVSLGIGAMVFTEKQTVRREERKAAERRMNAPKPPRASATEGAAVAASDATNASLTAAESADGEKVESGDDSGW